MNDRYSNGVTMTRTTRSALFVLPFAFGLLAVAAAPPRADEPDELIRRANEALRAGDLEAAEKLYATAEERTTDPGLVAYNRAAMYFEQKNYREAERHYDRVLEDASCPPERAARAWYNRGTCLLNRGGSIEAYRSAIACFENALDNPAADPEVKDRAPHNLELAKLHWNEERKKAAKPEDVTPNKPPPEERSNQPEPDRSPGGPDPTLTEDPNSPVAPKTALQPQSASQEGKNQKSAPTAQNVPANNPNLQVPEDKDEVQNLSPEAAREYMKEAAKRRKREFHALLEALYGPDKAGAKDR